MVVIQLGTYHSMFSEIIRKEAQYGRFVNLYRVAIVLTIEVGIYE